MVDFEDYEPYPAFDDNGEEVKCSNCNGTGEWGGWDSLYGPATPEECPVCSGLGCTNPALTPPSQA